MNNLMLSLLVCLLALALLAKAVPIADEDAIAELAPNGKVQKSNDTVDSANGDEKSLAARKKRWGYSYRYSYGGCGCGYGSNWHYSWWKR